VESKKDQLKNWLEHSLMVQQATTLKLEETLVDVEQRIERSQKDYAYFVEYYFPHYAKSKSAKFHVKAANKVLKTKNLRALFEWARGHAKSTHFDLFIPCWLNIQKEKGIHTMVLVGKSEDSAIKLLGDIQAEYQFNQRLINDFGPQYNNGSWAEGQFVTKNGTAFYAVGRGQSPRGLKNRAERPDYIVIDDLDDDIMCRNEARVNQTLDWVLEALIGAMDMGRGRFIMVGNRIHRKSVLAKFAERPNIYHTIVNALDKKGTPSWSEKYTKQEIQEHIEFMGYRRAQKEYFNNPIEEGTVFKEAWITWGKAPNLKKFEALIAYCDPSFKEGSKNDYKAIRLWGKYQNKLYLLKSFVRQATVTSMVSFFYNLHESLPEGVSCRYEMEANFLQDILLDEFTAEGNIRGYQLPIRGDKRKKPNKFLRIENTSPLYERGVIIYDEKLKEDEDTKTGTEQLLAFEKGSNVHDDAPDADEGAIYFLQKSSRIMKIAPIFGARNHRRAW